MTLFLQLTNRQHVTAISTYALTLNTDEERKG